MLCVSIVETVFPSHIGKLNRKQLGSSREASY